MKPTCRQEKQKIPGATFSRQAMSLRDFSKILTQNFLMIRMALRKPDFETLPYQAVSRA